MGGLKAPDMGALNSALKVKQFLNATKSKTKSTYYKGYSNLEQHQYQ